MFKRERRYLVIKGSDMAECLTEHEQAGLISMAQNVDSWRQSQGKPALDVFVVEADWPEFPIVIDMVRRRMEGLLTRDAEYAARLSDWQRNYGTLKLEHAELEKTVGDLSMLVKQLCRKLGKIHAKLILPNAEAAQRYGEVPDMCDKAMGYLKRKGLQGSPLRSVAGGDYDPSAPCSQLHSACLYSDAVQASDECPGHGVNCGDNVPGSGSSWINEFGAMVPRYAFIAKADGAYPKETPDGEWVKWDDHLAKLKAKLKEHGDTAMKEIDRLLTEAEKREAAIADYKTKAGAIICDLKVKLLFMQADVCRLERKSKAAIIIMAPLSIKAGVSNPSLIAMLREAEHEILHTQCGTCQGRGEVGGLLPGDGGYQNDTCPACEGKGTVMMGLEAEVECSTCGGGGATVSGWRKEVPDSAGGWWRWNGDPEDGPERVDVVMRNYGGAPQGFIIQLTDWAANIEGYMWLKEVIPATPKHLLF